LGKITSNQTRVAVIGLGLTGCASIRFLEKSGYAVGAFEENAQAPGIASLRIEFPNLPIVTGPLAQDKLSEFDEILLSPGVPRSHPVLQQLIGQGVPVRGDVDWFAKLVLRPIVAITGSNGKSTVVSWLTHVLNGCGFRAEAGGNIGVPVLELLDRPEAGIYVLELSSFQLESTEALAPTVACVLNVSADHLDRYPNLETYALVKQNIYRNARSVVINRQDALSQGKVIPGGMPNISFGLDAPHEGQFGLNANQKGEYLSFGHQQLCQVQDLPLPGRHNVANALAVLALAHALGVPLEQAIAPLLSFNGLPHRCEVVGQVGGVVCYNDSKATNVAAASAAIIGLGPSHRVAGRPGLVLLLGGLAKDDDFTPLLNCIQSEVSAVVVFGQAAEVLESQLTATVSVFRVQTLSAAFEVALDCAQAPGAVLLSPACASFDQFDNFKQRGQFFGHLVAKKMTQQEVL